MINGRNPAGDCRPGDTVFIYPGADDPNGSGIRHATVARVCDPAYDEVTGCLRVSVEARDTGTRETILVSPAVVSRQDLGRSRSGTSTYPMSL